MNEIRVRKPDRDLKEYLTFNTDRFDLTDIYNIYAEVAGHNDEYDWYWVLELRDGRFLLVSAWCDYTGWDCQSGGESEVASSAEEAAMLAPEKEAYTERYPRRALLAQLRGELPFGIEQIK